MKADLHLHTTASDGRLTPTELVKRAVECNLDVIAITDHDTIEGIPPALEAAREFPHLKIIPGVEISTELTDGEAHMLGYFLDFNNVQLNITLSELRNARWERGYKIVHNLINMGIAIKWERVQELAGEGSVGRPHIAQSLLEGGYISSLREAFSKYIGRNCPAYVPRKKITPIEAIEIILQADGLPVLAHPADINDLDSFILPLKEAGLKGLEIFCNGYTSNTIARLQLLAQKHSLVFSGGSDYHGLDDSIGGDIGNIDFPGEHVERLISMSKK